jgi:hypothetical protein
MLKIAAGLLGVALCPLLMFAEPSFSQTAQSGTAAPRPVGPPQQAVPSHQQPAPSPSSAPLPSPQQDPSPRLGAQPTPAAPEQPAEMTPQNMPLHEDASPPRHTPAQHSGAASHRHRDARRRHHDFAGLYVDESYVTPWSGPHVIERAHGDVAFVVEGYWFRALSACPRWEAGERVSFQAGPPGRCALLNRTRHRTCPVSCEGQPGWGPYL